MFVLLARHFQQGKGELCSKYSTTFKENKKFAQYGA